MARPSKLSDAQWVELGARYMAGDPPQEIAAEYGVTDRQIRRKAVLMGWMRNAAAIKREQVKAITSGITSAAALERSAELIHDQATLDAAVLSTAATAFAQSIADAKRVRLLLSKKVDAAHADGATKADEEECIFFVGKSKVVNEDLKIALAGYRDARGLNESAAAESYETWQLQRVDE